MRKMLQICAMAMIVPVAGVSVAEVSAADVSAADAGDHYIYLSDGQVLAYPKEMVKALDTGAGGCTLTLLNDSVLVWTAEQLDSVGQVAPDFPELASLVFEEDLNDELTDDIEAVISDGKATATVPAIGRYLTPTFATDSEGALVYADGAELVSGVSRLHFARPLTYTVAQPGHRRMAFVKLTDEVWSEAGITTREIPLTAGMLSTNAPTSLDGEGLDRMLDGDASTFFHSTWSKDEVYDVDLTKQVYVQADLEQPVKEFLFHYVSRPNTERYNIQEWRIEASDDGTSWTEVEVLNEAGGLPVAGQGLEYTSSPIVMDKACSHLRFTATRVGYKNYLCLAEFSLLEVTGRVEEPELLRPATYAFRMVPMGSEVVVDIDWPAEHTDAVPRIDIDIDGGVMVTSKDYYLNALITIQGKGLWPDFQDSVQIKGRGNTSWRDFDKKPYRLKFATSVKPFGWKKGKNWNLLAQAQTGSMMTNPVAMKIARMVGAAAANDVMPADLYMNGKYLGSYLFTQKTGLANNSVDIKDESQAAFLELDKYYDEVYKFKSANYALPVNIKEPDLAEGESRLHFEQIQSDFNRFEQALKQDAHFERFIDIDKLVRFMLVNELVLNAELGHPKSVFLYRENLNHLCSAYTFGPVWDFDWAFGYESNRNYCSTGITNDLFASYDTSRPGSRFFTALWQTSPWVKHCYYRLWHDFMEQHLQEVLDYVDDYYAFAGASFVNNTKAWSDGAAYEANALRMKTWLAQRAAYLMGSIGQYDLQAPPPYTFGDVNTDGAIDDADLQALLDHLLERDAAAEDFAAQQADIDADECVSASDVAWLCSRINPLSGNQIAALFHWDGWLMEAGENDRPVSLETIATGEGWQVNVQLDNKHPYIACMMDFILPDGVTVSGGEEAIAPAVRTETTHLWAGSATGTNGYRVVGYSTDNLAMADTLGTLFSFTLTADAPLEGDTFPLQAGNIRFVSTNGQEAAFSDVQTMLSVSPDAIRPTVAVPASGIVWPADIYDLQGRLLRRQAHTLQGLGKGIYIINRRKVAVE